MNINKLYTKHIRTLMVLVLVAAGFTSASAADGLKAITGNFSLSASDLPTTESKVIAGYYLPVSTDAGNEDYYIHINGDRSTGTSNNKTYVCVKNTYGISFRLAANSRYIFTANYFGSVSDKDDPEKRRDRGLTVTKGDTPDLNAQISGAGWDGLSTEHTVTLDITTTEEATYWILGTEIKGGETNLYSFSLTQITASHPDLRDVEIDDDYVWYSSATLTANSLFGMSGYNNDAQKLYFYNRTNEDLTPDARGQYIHNTGPYTGLALDKTSFYSGKPGAGIGFRIAQGKKAKVRILATYPADATDGKDIYLEKGDDFTTSTSTESTRSSLNSTETYLVIREFDVTSDLTSQAQTYWVTGFVSFLGLEILIDNNPNEYNVGTLAALSDGTHTEWFDSYRANQIFNMGYFGSNNAYHLGNDRVSDGSTYDGHNTYEWTSNDAIGFKIPNYRRAKVTVFFKKQYNEQGIERPGFKLVKGNTYSSTATPESTVQLVGSEYTNTGDELTLTFDDVDNTSGAPMVLWIAGLNDWDPYLMAGYQVQLTDITPTQVDTTPITDDYVWNGTSSTTLAADATFGGGYLGNNGTTKSPVMDGADAATTTVNGAAHTLYDFSADGQTLSFTVAADLQGEIRVYYIAATSGISTPMLSKGTDLLTATAITGLSSKTQEGTSYISYNFTSTDPRSFFISGGQIAGVEVLVHNEEAFNLADMTVTTKGEIKDIFGNNFTWKPLDSDNTTINGSDQVLSGNCYYKNYSEKRQYFVGDDRVVTSHTVSGNRAVVIDNNFKQGFLLEGGSKYRITIYWDRVVSDQGSIAFKHGTDPASLTTYENTEFFSTRPATYDLDLKDLEGNEMVWITGGQSQVYYAGFKIEVLNDYAIIFDTDVPGIFTGTYKNKLLIYCTDNGTQENFVVPTVYYKNNDSYTDITNKDLSNGSKSYQFDLLKTYSAADGSYADTNPGFTATESPGKVSLYLQDFTESDTGTANKLNDWESPNNFAGLSIAGNDDGYLHIQGDVSGNRTYKTTWGTDIYGTDYSNIPDGTYTVEFDFNPQIGPNEFNSNKTSITLVSNISPANNTIYRSDDTKVGYLFDLTWDNTIGQRSNMTFVINGNENERVTLQSSEWYTFTLEVNVAQRKVGYEIKTREGSVVAIGSRTVPDREGSTDVSMYAQGLNICLSRNYGQFNVDNVEVSTQSLDNPEYNYTLTGFEDTDQDKLFKVTYRYATGDASEPYVEDYYYLWFANFLKIGWWVNRDAKLIVGSNNSASDPNHIIVGDFYVSSGSTGNFFYQAFDPTDFTGATWKYTNDKKREAPDGIDRTSEAWTTMNDDNSKGHYIQLGYPSADDLRDYWSTVDGNNRIYDSEVIKTVDFKASRGEDWPEWTARIRFRFVPAPTLEIEDYYIDGTGQSSTEYDATYTSAKVKMTGYNGVTGGAAVENATIYYTTDGSTPTIENNTATNATYVYDSSAKPENEYTAVYYAAEYIKTPMVFYLNNPFTTYIEGMTFANMLGLSNQSQNFVARSKILSVPVRDTKVEYLNSDYKFVRTKADGSVLNSNKKAAVDGGTEYKYPFDYSTSNPVQMSVLFGNKDTECYRSNAFPKVGAKWKNDANNDFEEHLDFDLYKYKTIGDNYNSQNGNPQTECNLGIGGANTENGGMFLQPVAGDFLRFEPEYDGVITVWMRTNGAGQADEKGGNITRRPVYIVDENGKVMKRSTVKPSSEHFFSLNGTYGEINSIKSLIRQDCRIDWLNGLDHWKRGYFEKDKEDQPITTPMEIRYQATFKIFNYWYGYPLYQNMNKLGHTGAQDAEYYRHTMDVPDSWISRTAMVQSVICPYNSLLYHSENIYNNIETGDDAVTFYDGRMVKDGANYKKSTIWDGDKFAKYGYELPAYNTVRYRFPVKAGKSYYIGGRGTKNGFMAMKFDKLEVNYDPSTYNYADNRTIKESDYTCTSVSLPGTKTYKATDIDNSYLSSGTTSYDRIATYHLYESYNAGNSDILNLTPISWANAQQGTTCNVQVHRTFKPGRWHAIVLPFSVSETRMKQIFGDKVQVLYLDPYANTLMTGGDYKSAVYPAVRQSGTVPRLMFTYHKYQMLYANTPAFICPDPDLDEDIEDYTFERVTIDKTNLSGNSYDNIGYKIGEIGDYEYWVVGSYNTTDAEDNGEMYYLDNVKDATGNYAATIYHSQTGVDMKGTRCWIVPKAKTGNGGTAPQRAPLLMEIGYNDFTGENYDVENSTTAIHDIVIDDTTADMYNDGNVYDVMGRKVGEGSLDGLLPGIYIYQGRKIYIR